MNKLAFLLFLGFFSLTTIQAQDFQAEALYRVRDLLRPEAEKNYRLTFDATSSIFQDEITTANTSIYYKNTNTRLFVVNKKLTGKDYLISGPLIQFDWKIETEIKIILGYKCTKATAQNGQITAWFSSEIPGNQGPEIYSGLPGLILEVGLEKKLISCIKISLLPPGKVQIKGPVKGIKVSQKQFEALSQKK